MTKFNELRREQLDARLAGLSAARAIVRPRQGWVRTIREALGMSLRQLAERVGLTKSAVAALEDREVDRRITIESLSKLADALESELVYFIVPKRSLQGTVEDRARTLAGELVCRVDDSMDLEMQRTSPEERERLVHGLVERLLQSEKRLWDV
jgi:predicted DNA-binding mobile mystery protein A